MSCLPPQPDEAFFGQLFDQLMRCQGRGSDVSSINVELRERGPVRSEPTVSLRSTAKELSRAGEDAAELVRAEAPTRPATVVTSAAMPPGDIAVRDVKEDIIGALSATLEQDNAAYDRDPASLRTDDSVTANVAMSAYFAYRAAAIGYHRFVAAAARAYSGAMGEWTADDTKDIIKDVIAAILVAIVLVEIGLSAG